MTPRVRVRPVTSARARLLRRYPVSSIAARTRARVTALTLGWPLRTRETVCAETPATRATSAIAGPRPRGDGSGGDAGTTGPPRRVHVRVPGSVVDATDRAPPPHHRTRCGFVVDDNRHCLTEREPGARLGGRQHWSRGCYGYQPCVRVSAHAQHGPPLRTESSEGAP